MRCTGVNSEIKYDTLDQFPFKKSWKSSQVHAFRETMYGYYFEEYAVIVVLRMSKFPMIGRNYSFS